jgi:diguanylate cyclase (GGDEF)-like protein
LPKPGTDAAAPAPKTEVGLNSTVAERIIGMLEEGPPTPSGWRDAMARLARQSGPGVYSALLFVLTQLDFEERPAREHWDRILRQWEVLNRRVPEKVDLRVAVLQYFLRSQRKLHNPAIVEIKLLKRTQASAIYDELTRLYNYRYFQDRVVSETRRAMRYDDALTLMMIDVDDFKSYNDCRGHLAGNMALRRLASVLRRSVREVDVAARYGGEEFAVLLPNTPKLAALKLAEKIRHAIEKAGIGKSEPGDSGRPLTVSIGVASVPGDASGAEQLVERADSALYIAKSMGKNCVKPFSDERREHTRLDATLSGHYLALARERHPFATTNVSEGGILFHSAEPLACGALLRLSLRLPPGEPIECAVKVLRVIGARGGFEVGTQILHMTRPHERRFRQFIAQLKAGGAAGPAPRARKPRAVPVPLG